MARFRQDIIYPHKRRSTGRQIDEFRLRSGKSDEGLFLGLPYQREASGGDDIRPYRGPGTGLVSEGRISVRVQANIQMRLYRLRECVERGQIDSRSVNHQPEALRASKVAP